MNEPIKFLVVDDTEENLVALEALLRREGLQVLMARSGIEALELLLVHDVALALLDVQMPGMDGFELAEIMRGTERTKHVPIIFVTAGTHDPQRVFKGYEFGAVDFLYKPVDPNVLRSKADVFFELHRQRQALADALRLSELFMGILGHDLRNPLNTLFIGTQVLAGQLTDERQLAMLRRMKAAGQRMSDMIEQLLDLTRARLGGGVGFSRASERVDVDVLEVGQERLVVGVVVREVLHAQRAAELVEAVERAVVEAERHPLHQRHPLVGRHRQLARAQLEQEVDQHRRATPWLACPPAPCPARS